MAGAGLLEPGGESILQRQHRGLDITVADQCGGTRGGHKVPLGGKTEVVRTMVLGMLQVPAEGRCEPVPRRVGLDVRIDVVAGSRGSRRRQDLQREFQCAQRRERAGGHQSDLRPHDQKLK
jgi:hypothetical protein